MSAATTVSSADWGTSRLQSHAAVMLKNDSRQSHRWTCVHCHANHPKLADHKMAELAIIHWWKHHSHPACWTWRDTASALKVTTAEMCQAVISIDLSVEPLPAGAAHHMLPNSLPSHPRGLDKRLSKTPYSKTLTPLEKSPPAKELTSWGWDLVLSSVLEGNSDVLASPLC